MTNLRSRSAWIALTAVLSVELLLGAVLVFRMVPTFPAAGPDRDALVPLWISLFVSTILCCVWIAATLAGALKRQGSWVRGSAVTIHMLMFAAALGVFQGLLGTVGAGITLLALAIIGFAAALLTGTPRQAPANAAADAA